MKNYLGYYASVFIFRYFAWPYHFPCLLPWFAVASFFHCIGNDFLIHIIIIIIITHEKKGRRTNELNITMSVNVYKVKSKTHTERVVRMRERLTRIMRAPFALLDVSNAIACAMCMSQDSIHYRCDCVYAYIFGPISHEPNIFSPSTVVVVVAAAAPIRCMFVWVYRCVAVHSTICFSARSDPHAAFAVCFSFLYTQTSNCIFQ